MGRSCFLGKNKVYNAGTKDESRLERNEANSAVLPPMIEPNKVLVAESNDDLRIVLSCQEFSQCPISYI